MPLKRGRRRRLDESGEGCESGGESDSKNFYFDVAEDEVLEGGSVGGKSTPTTTSPPTASSSSSTSTTSSSSSSASTASATTGLPTKKFDFSSIAIRTSEDLKLSWKDSLLETMTFAHNEDEKAEASATSPRDEEAEFCFDLGKSSDDERCLEEIPQEMVRELTELRSYNSTLQDMIKDVQQFNSYQRKKRRQWELSKINNGSGTVTASAGSALASSTTAAPSDALPQWLVSDFSSLSNKLVDLSSDAHTSSSSSSSASASTSSATHHREEGHDMDYLAAWQQSMANHGAPLQLPAQLAQLAGLQQQQQQQQPPQSSSAAPQSGPAPFTTSLPFTEV
jgi:hypothetical protein